MVEKLKETKKSVSMRDYDDMMEKLISSSEHEKNNLDHQITLRKSNLMSVQDQINRSQSEFERWKKLETDKFKKIQASKENDFITRERAIRVGEDEFANRMRDLENREHRVKDLVDERAKLVNERIEVEKLHRHSEALIKSAHDKLAEADSKFHKSSMAMTLMQEREKKIELAERNLSSREEVTENNLREIKNREKNLEEVKKVIDPKLAELKVLEDGIKTKEKELTIKESEVNSKISDQGAILRGLEEREKKVKERERMVAQKDEDITRKALLAGLKET